MVMRRIFGRKKDKDEEEETEAEVEDTIEDEESVEETEETTEEEPAEDSLEYDEVTVEAEVEDVGGTIPYHDSIKDRLMFLITEPEFASMMEAPDAFCLEFMAMGERFRLEKESMGIVDIQSGAARDNDAHIRIANDVVSKLLSAATFKEFSEIYMKYYKNPETGLFVRIEMCEDVSNLNRRGYARVPLLKLLIGAAR